MQNEMWLDQVIVNENKGNWIHKWVYLEALVLVKQNDGVNIDIGGGVYFQQQS